jgi:hypothetical protein
MSEPESALVHHLAAREHTFIKLDRADSIASVKSWQSPPELSPTAPLARAISRDRAKSGDRMSKELNALNKRQLGNSAYSACGISQLSQNLGEASSCITA